MFKVCHIISGDLWAGAEVMAFHLLKGLLKYDDLKLIAILLNSGRLAEEIYGLGVPVEVFDETKLNFFQLVSKIRKAIYDSSPDIIHSHRYKENILAFLSLWRNRNSRLVSTSHGLPESNGVRFNIKGNLISKANSALLAKRFDAVVAVSREVKKFLIEKEGCLEERVQLIHNGIELPENFHRAKSKGPFVIGSAGRLFPVKDFPLMVEIARVIAGRARNIIFKVAGDGPERDNIFSMIKKYGLEENFKLVGSVQNMSQFYEELDLYLNTSLHEGIPISVLEAMGNGLPIIAPLVGGFSEIIEDGVHGLLVENRNPFDFAEKCLALYDNDQLRMRMGEAARQRVKEDFSIEKMVSQYYKLYRDVTAG
ncbi:MAG: glycosyltransferase family 4 protein [Candidatus Omnitrophica bacterium]|nr:glycosyltransferase family 4 protein [Candidatus Omnitrophota bacterium]